MSAKTHEQFIRDINEINPDIDVLGKYINSKTKIKCRCKKCGNIWDAQPTNIWSGHGCKKCGIISRNIKHMKSQDQFLKELKSKNIPVEPLEDYKGTHEPISCKCLNCGNVWKVRPHHLLRGHGCPICAKTSTSFLEQFLLESFRKALGDKEVLSRDRTAIGMELDIYVPSFNIAIEPGSWKFHMNSFKRDVQKITKCQNKGIRLITIYTDYYDEIPPLKEDCYVFPMNLSVEKEDLIRSLIQSLFQKTNINTSFSEKDWNALFNKAIINSRRISTEAFSKELIRINPDIEVIGQYAGMNIGIQCRCKKCGYVWKPIPANLKNGSGCPQCYGNVKRTHKQFLKELSAVNDSIEVLEEYTNTNAKILCRCKKCNHEWTPTPRSLLDGHGCPQCAGRIKTSQRFLEEIKEKNDSIELLSEYINSQTKVTCKCMKCGYIWDGNPTDLLQGHACPNCAGNIKKTQEEFIKEVFEKNPSIEILGRYVNRKTKIQCRCKKCGYKWETTPDGLIRGYACPKCAGTLKKTQNQYEEELAKVNPNISVLGKYINSHAPIKVKCNCCGTEWSPQAVTLLRGHGCPNCAKQKPSKRKKTQEAFERDLHNVYPNIEVLGKYINNKTHILVKCKDCGNRWEVTPNNLLRGNGCSLCHKKEKNTLD